MKRFDYISLVCETDRRIPSLKQNYVAREDILTFLDEVRNLKSLPDPTR